MSDIPFHATVQGRRYYEHQLPELIRQVTRLANALEKLAMNPVSMNPASQGATTQEVSSDGEDRYPHQDPDRS